MNPLRAMLERYDIVMWDLAHREKFLDEVQIGSWNECTFNAGWIDGKPTDRRHLRQLGVRGRMRYSNGTFEMCIASDEVIKRLLVAGWAGDISFTTCDARTTVQLPRRKQTWWSWPSKRQLEYEGYVKAPEAT